MSVQKFNLVKSLGWITVSTQKRIWDLTNWSEINTIV